jgi:hypothetical protein
VCGGVCDGVCAAVCGGVCNGVCCVASSTGELEGEGDVAVERGLGTELELPVELKSVFSSPDASSPGEREERAER